MLQPGRNDRRGREREELLVSRDDVIERGTPPRPPRTAFVRPVLRVFICRQLSTDVQLWVISGHSLDTKQGIGQ
jgi:hypothetical protein